jgi:hypothetical protein
MLRQTVRDILHRAEARYGYFLPFRISAARSDELLGEIQHLLREQQIATALAIGGCTRNGSADALLAGARESRGRPTVFLFSPFRYRAQAPYENMSWQRMSRGDQSKVAADLRESLRRIRTVRSIVDFDVLVIDGSKARNMDLPIDILLEEAQRARFVFLIGLERCEIHLTYASLRESDEFVLVQQHPDLWGGYAFFERSNLVTESGIGTRATSSPASMIESTSYASDSLLGETAVRSTHYSMFINATNREGTHD